MLQLKKLYDENWKFFAWVLAATVAILLLFNGNCGKVDKPVIIPVKEQEKTVERAENKINPVIDSIALENGNIQKSIEPTQKELKKSQAKTQDIIKSKNWGTSIGGTDTKHFSEITAGISIGDITEEQHERLKNAVAGGVAVADYFDKLGESATKSDSLANIIIDSLNKVISNKDKIIKLKTDLNDSLKLAFEVSIDQQKLLTAYSKKLERKVKWTQAGKWGWKAAAVAGGLFILKSTIK